MNQESFGMALKAARKGSGLTQGGLADKIVDVGGPVLTQQVISNWERNVNLPGDRFSFMVLCKALYENNGLTSVEQINQLLEPAQEGALHGAEIAQWFPQLALADVTDESEEIRAAMSSQEEAEQEEAVQEEEQAGQEPNILVMTPSEVALTTRQEAPSSPLAPLPSKQGIVHQLLYLQQKLAQQMDAIGAVIIVMWLLALFWRTKDWWHEPQHAWQITVAFWVSNLLLVMLPSLTEQQQAKQYAVAQLKLSRLSGTGSALTLIAGFLLWMEALSQVIFESPLAVWLLYPVILLGVAYAYAAGVNVQFWHHEQHETSQKAYLRNTIIVSISSFAAQAALVWSCYFLYSQLPDMLWHVLMLAPPVLMILARWRRPKR